MNVVVIDEVTGGGDDVLRLNLAQVGSSVVLEAVDTKGNRLPSGNILEIHADGTFTRTPGVTAPGIDGTIREA